MDGNKFFDSEAYFSEVCAGNCLARQNEFKFCTCSGIEGLEGPLSLMRSDKALFCLDDTNDGSIIRGRNGGFFKNRTFTVFLLYRYQVGNDADRQRKLSICRELFRQVLSKIVIDESDMKRDMIYLQSETVMSRELGHFMNGVTGLYFFVDVAEPVNLKFSADEWKTTNY